MQIKDKSIEQGELKFKVVLDQGELEKTKQHVLGDLSVQVKIAGFRAGKAPLSLVEKNVDANTLQREVLEHAINNSYPKAIEQLKERTLSNPSINIEKFVPFTTLEFTASVAVAGEIRLADYKNHKVKIEKVEVSEKEIDDVLKSLQKRLADKKDVERPAKDGDMIWIDFSGTDAKNQPLKGADGKDYPLVIGSNTFIPGFEPNLIGLKKDEEKTFKVKFPADYHAAHLQNKQVTFKVKVNKVQEVVEPEVNDEFAAKAGPFTTLKQLKDDIKHQLTHEKQQRNDSKLQNDLLEKIVKNSTVGAPVQLVSAQAESEIKRLKQNLVYRGQTYQEYLEAKGLKEDEFIEKEVKPVAIERVKAALILSEIAYKEEIKVGKEELDAYISRLKQHYSDPNMQAQLEDPANRSDLASQLLTQKTLQKIKELNPQN